MPKPSDSIIKKIAQLKKKINEHNYHYHIRDAPVINDAAYDKNSIEIKTKQGIVENQTPSGETNPNYMAQPTFLSAFPGRDTLVLDPKTRMLTNTRMAQGGRNAQRRMANNMRTNNRTNNTNNTTTTTTTRSGSSGGSGMSGGGY